MADIFLSYNEKDRSAVSRLAETLQSVGWSVWWDRRIPAGSTWRGVLERELQSMRCMVVLWSSNSVHSEWVCEEASEGRQLGRLVPVSIDRVRPPAGFREIQAADLVDWDGSRNFVGLQRLLEDIERLIGKPGATPPETSNPEPRVAADGHAGFEGQAEDDAPHTLAHEAPDKPLPGPTPPARRLAPWGVVALLGLIAVGGYFGVARREPVDTARDPSRPPTLTATTSTPRDAAAAASAGPNGPTLPPTVAATTPVTTAAVPPTATSPAAAASKAPGPSAGTGAKNVKAPASVNPRCAALLERLALGETLSGPSQLFFNQECRQ